MMKHQCIRWLDLGILVLLLIPISIVDIKTRKIPDILIFIGLTALLATKLFIPGGLSLWIVIDTAVAFGFIFVIWYVTKGGIGLGDAKLSGLLGLALGVPFWLFAMFIASVTGAITGFLLIVFKKIDRKEGIPFGPFLAAGGLISYTIEYFIVKDVARLWQNLIPFAQ